MPADKVPASEPRGRRPALIVPATLIGIIIGLVFGAIFAAIMLVLVVTRTWLSV